jgi:Ala-tRNA(Pro) deacylase
MHDFIFQTLEEQHISFQNHEHEKVYTVAQADKIDKGINAQATKNLFVKDKKKNYFLITAVADKAINLKQVAKQIGAKGGSLSFVNADQLLEMMNLTPGSVTPFGLLVAKQRGFDITFYLDQEVYDAQTLGIHPMRNDMTTVLKTTDLEKLLISKSISCNFIDL